MGYSIFLHSLSIAYVNEHNISQFNVLFIFFLDYSWLRNLQLTLEICPIFIN